MSKPSYVLPTQDDLPVHLKDRNPFRLQRVDMILRLTRGAVIGEDGRILMAGAIEFQTQVTPNLLTDACDPMVTWKPEMSQKSRFEVVYDPTIQRGEKDGKGGIPAPAINEKQIVEMMDDIQKNEFECPPLMWNLRDGQTVWVYLTESRELLIFQGVATRPDTNHRHHAIIRMHQKYRQWVEATDSEEMDGYNPQRAYSLIIHTDTFEGEARKFFVYNTKGTDVSQSKAHYVISQTANPNTFSKLARELMDGSGLLTTRNVEVVQTVLSKNSAKMVLFYTLVRGLEAGFPNLTTESGDYAEVRQYLIEFLGELGRARPQEIGLLTLQARQQVRLETVADQAIMWIAYLRLAGWLRANAAKRWRDAFASLGNYRHERDGAVVYEGDLMGRQNPLWRERGILALTDKGAYRVISNRNAQDQAFNVLRDIVSQALAAPVAAAA